jgi:hypothetical protein
MSSVLRVFCGTGNVTKLSADFTDFTNDFGEWLCN